MLSDDSSAMCADWLFYDEEYRPFAYDDANDEIVKAPKGKLTIGIGFNIQDTGLTLPECMFILKNRINIYGHSIASVWQEFNELDDVRKCALINIGYNVGLHGLMKFKETLTYLSVKDYTNASKAIMDSMAAKKEPYRYERLSHAILTGSYPDVITTHSINN